MSSSTTVGAKKSITKVPLAHKRAEKENWSATAPAQRKHLVEFLKQMIPQLESAPVPVPCACADKVCYELDVTLNGETVGIIHRRKSGWKINHIADQKFVDAIGGQIMLWYE
jgi:hypothetical protein